MSGIYFAPDVRLSDFFIRFARGSSGEKKMILAKVACGSIGERDATSRWWPAERKHAALRHRSQPYGSSCILPRIVITYKLGRVHNGSTQWQRADAPRSTQPSGTASKDGSIVVQ